MSKDLYDLARRIYGATNVLFVYAGDRFEISAGDSGIKLMPLKADICSKEFFRQLKAQKDGVSTLCVLREDLCTCFMQDVEKIWNLGIRNIFCYDNVFQMYCDVFQMFDFSSFTIEKKKIRYQEGRSITFAPSRNSPNVRVGAINDITAKVREHLDDFHGMPAWLVAQKMLDLHPGINIEFHVWAQAIRQVRGQETMAKFPLLHELVSWIIQESSREGLVLDFSEEKSYEDLLSMCLIHIKLSKTYLNVKNLKKVVGHIQKESVLV